jgi:hypothetical protein
MQFEGDIAQRPKTRTRMFHQARSPRLKEALYSDDCVRPNIFKKRPLVAFAKEELFRDVVSFYSDWH